MRRDSFASLRPPRPTPINRRRANAAPNRPPMEHAYDHLLHLLAAHATWTLAVVVVAAFLESLALIGTFIPGSTAMFIAGAFAATGTINLGWLFVCAIAGAVADPRSLA